MHATHLADPAGIVAPEINQHQVLGELLRIIQQFLLEREILLGRPAAWAGAGDRPYRDCLVFETHQYLGRRSDHVMVTEIQVIQVRRRIEAT